MNPKILISTALVTMLLTGAAQADSERREEGSANAPEVKISMQQAIDVAENHTGGKAKEAELEHEDGAARYEVKILTEEGTREVYVSAGDGSILSSDENR